MPTPEDCLGTDPGMSVPLCRQAQFLDMPALFNPHSHAEPSVKSGPSQSRAPLQGAPVSSTGRAGLSKMR